MSDKYNSLVRATASKHRIYMYEVAVLMGISVSTLNRDLRHEWSEEKQKRVAALIEEYAANKRGVYDGKSV